MHKPRKLLQRIVSATLSAVMFMGTLPVQQIFGGGSGGGGGETGGVSSSPSDIAYTKDDGLFTRFTLVKIDAAECDSTSQYQGKEDVSLALNPYAGQDKFQDTDYLLNPDNYEVIGSINLSDWRHPFVSDYVTMNATNAYDYRRISYTGGIEAASDYWLNSCVLSSQMTDATNGGHIYLTWDQFVEKVASMSGAQADYVRNSLNTNYKDKFKPYFIEPNGATGIIQDLFTVGGQVSGETANYASTSDFFAALLTIFGYHTFDESAQASHPNMFYSETYDTYKSIVFKFDGPESEGGTGVYRLLIEPGFVFKDKSQGPAYFGVTARDLIMYLRRYDSIGTQMGRSAMQNLLNCAIDSYQQPYGYFAYPNTAPVGTYSTITVNNANAGLWYPGYPVDTKWSTIKDELVERMFRAGIKAGSPEALGLIVFTPLHYEPISTGLTIKKVVQGADDELDRDWSFKLMLEPPDGNSNPDGPFTIFKGTSTEPIEEFATFDELIAHFEDKFILKSGETLRIEGLPTGTKYTVEEVFPDDLEQAPTVDDGEMPPEDTWVTTVMDTGAENTGSVTGTTTSGTISEAGIASVTFTNAKVGGPAHLIIDYNLPGASATYDEETGVITSETVVDCGTHYVGQTIPVTAYMNSEGVQQPLEVGDTIETVIRDSNGEPISAKFLGLYQHPWKKDSPLEKDSGDNSTWYWTFGHEELTVIYAQWEFTTGSDDDVDIKPSEGDLYTVFWDYNYDGGGSTSSLAGYYRYTGSQVVGSVSGSYEFELPITFSVPDDPVREGHSFYGWSLDPYAKQGSYSPPDPGESDTYYAIWGALDITWDANGGKFVSNDAETKMYDAKPHVRGEFIDVPEEKPYREGYTFNGWFMDKECTQPIETYEEGVMPGRTYYAGWTAERVIVTYYDVREGTSVVHTQEYNYNDAFDIFDDMESTVGWNFTDWALADGSSAKDKDGAFLNKADWGENLVYHPGGDLGGTETPDNSEDDDGSVVSDRGYWTIDIKAVWEENTTDYDVSIKWNDLNNNDGARPLSVHVALVDSRNNNSVVQDFEITGDKRADVWTHTFTDLPISDNDSSLQKRTYGIIFLGYTDIKGIYREIKAPALDGQEGNIPMMAPSSVDEDQGTWTTYDYGVNNFGMSGTSNGEYDTTITFDHSLITTDDEIKFTMVWDDESDNDGARPSAVTLVLYADGVPVQDNPMHNSGTGVEFVSPAMCDITDDGDTWTYIFKDYQKYNDGVAIDYTVAIKNPDQNATFNQNGYTVTYTTTAGDSAIGDPIGCVIYRPIELHEVPFNIVWDDEFNRDGQRPDYVSVALMSYQWNNKTYRWETVEIDTQVVNADDLNTITSGNWSGTFGDYPVYHDGLEAIYHLVVTSDLNAFIPEGSFEYGWRESEYGNQKKVTPEVIISQNTNTVSVTANVYWNDSQDNDNIRPENIILQLYAHAPNETTSWKVDGQQYRVTISGDKNADNWYYTFSGMPKYAEGQSGVELIYTVEAVEVDGEPLYGTYIIDTNGEQETVVRYEASYLYEDNTDPNVVEGSTVETDDLNKSDRAYVKLTHICETQTMNFSVNWHDADNRDNVRPTNVMVDMYKTVGDGEPVYQKTLDIIAGPYDTWTYRVTDLAGYENGLPVKYTVEVPQDVQENLASLGYTVSTQDNIIHMYYTPATGSITTKIYWSDEDDNDGYRPDSVIATLYANGISTGKTVDLNETNSWTHTWQDLAVHYVEGTEEGTDVVYSVKVEVPEHYSVTYNPESTTIEAKEVLQVQLHHGGDTTTVPVKVYWNDQSNNDHKRPETLTVQLLSDGEPTDFTLTLSNENADETGNVWTGQFENQPVFSGDGKKIYYSLKVYDPTTTTGGYEVMTAGTTLYLSKDPILSTMYVSFQFDDVNNADGKRPTGLYLQLTANGVPVDDSEYLHTVSFDTNVDGYKWLFGELPVYAGDGTKIKYNVDVQFDEEFGATDYDVWTSNDIILSEGSNAALNQIIVKLSREADVITKTGHIFWFDCNDLFGQRPDALTVTLEDNYTGNKVPYVINVADGTVTNRNTGEVAGTVEVREWTGDSSVWVYTIDDLQANYETSAHKSVNIYYWVTATTTNIAEYYPIVHTGEDNGMDVSLTHAHYSEYAAQASQDYTLNVQWIDNANAWGYRPNSNGIKVELKANGETYDVLYLTEANVMNGNENAWTYTWNTLPTYRDGEAIVWTVSVDDIQSYTQFETAFTSQATTIAYKQSVGFDFSTYWNDSDNDDAVRPEDITLDVFADGSKVGSVVMTGDSNTWTGNISDMLVWRESDADAAIQYTFRWDNETEEYLRTTGYTAAPTLNGMPVDSDWFYYLSATKFGSNTDSGYDDLTGTYDWETTLSYNKEVADYNFSVIFEDEVDRDGFRPDTLSVNLLANGEVIDTRVLDINSDDSVYPMTWEDLEVWESGVQIIYTIELVEIPDEYMASYNEAHTSVTLSHTPLRVSVTGQVIWDDTTELKDVLNPDGEYVRSYEQITRVPVYIQLLADGQETGEPVRISSSVYGEGEVLEKIADVTWDNLYKYHDNGTEIVYTIKIYSNELTAILNDGHNLTYDFDTQYMPSGIITHDLYDIRGTVYFQYDYSDDFLLANVPVTAYLNDGDELVSQGSTVTDEDGNFEFLNLPQGLYTIRATYLYGDVEMAGTQGAELDRQDTNEVIVVVDRDSANDGDYYKYNATGQAFYQTDSTNPETKHPVPEGSIALLYRLNDESDTPEYIGIDTIGTNGTYKFENLSPADYIVNIMFNYNNGNYTYDNNDAVADGLKFTIVGSDTVWPDIVKQVNADVDPEEPDEPENPDIEPPVEPKPCIVNGHVYYSDAGVHTTDPVVGVDVYIYTENENTLVGMATTDENGFWETEGIGEGTYVAVFTYEGNESRVLVFTITDEIFEVGTYEVATQYFDRLTKTPAGRIDGTVLDEEGYPLHAFVGLYDENGDVVDFSYTDNMGYYQFTVTAGFDYNVRILRVFDDVKTYAAGNPDDEFTTLDYYTLEGNFYIGQEPQPWQLVMVYKTTDNVRWNVVTAGMTDANGEFNIRVYEEGNYMIVPYINEKEYAKYYVSVGYQDNRPSITQGANGLYEIAGTDSFDELRLYKFTTPGSEDMCYELTSPSESYHITNRESGNYRMELVKDGVKTVYYFTCPAEAIIDVNYYMTISGYVRDSYGNPIIGSEVRVLDSEGQPVDDTVIIFSDGYYGFSNLIQGDYTVEITTPRTSDELANKWTYEYDSYNRIYPDGITDGDTWTWNINANVVTGSVTDQKGRPIENALVQFNLQGHGNQEDHYSVRTDENGEYTIGLAPGRYSTICNYYWDGTHAYEGTGPDYVDIDEDTSEIDFVIERYDLTIKTVRAIDETPVEDVDLTVRFSGDGTLYQTGETDNNGEMTLIVYPDTYIIDAVYNGIRGNLNTGKITADKTVVIPLNSMIYITGTVTDHEGEIITDGVVYYDNGNGLSGHVYTDESGQYSIEIPANDAGDFDIWAESDVFVSDTTNISVTTDVVHDIVIDKSGEGLNYKITGVVTDEDGNRLANALVTMTWGNDKTENRTTSTNELGEYQFTVTDGTYYLNVSYEYEGNVYTSNAEYTVHVDGANVEQNLVVLKGYPVVVTVKDKDGYTVSGAEVWYTGVASGKTLTDSDGVATLYLPKGDYRFYASTESRVSDTVSVEVSGITNFELVLKNVGIADEPPVVYPEELTIWGYVYNPEGYPVSGVTVTLYKQDFETLEWYMVQFAGTNEDGYYEFPHLEDGVYRVDAEYVYTTEANVLDRGHVVEGVVSDDEGNPMMNAKVELWTRDGDLISTITTGEDGAYCFENVSMFEEYKLVIYGADEVLYKEMDVTQVATEKHISGVIKNVAGDIVEGATVNIYDSEKGLVTSLITDESGKYSIAVDGLKGPYTIEVTYPLSYVIDTDIYVRDTTDRNAPYISPSWYTIEGYVHDKDGNPVEGATVQLFDESNTIKLDEYITAADGYYIFDELEDGIYHVHIIYRDDVEHDYEVDTGTGESEDTAPAEINVEVKNFSKGQFDEPIDGWREGENKFQLTSQYALRAFIEEDDGTFTELYCSQLQGDTYEFTIDAEDGDVIVVVTIGDTNLDGTVSITDASFASRYMVGLYDLNKYQMLSTDANKDDIVSITDASFISRYMVGLYVFTWSFL